MRVRPVLASLTVAAAVASGAAGAAPKLPCQLVTDPANDTFLLRYQQTANDLGAPVPFGPQEDSLDITSADVASDAKTLTAVIRVKNLASAATTAPGGIAFDLNFTIPDGPAPLYVRATSPAGGTPVFEAGYKESVEVTTVATKLGDGTGTFDVAKGEIRIHVPLTVFSAQGTGIKAGKALTLGEITSGRAGGGRSVFADAVVADKVYKAAAKNCVVPGK